MIYCVDCGWQTVPEAQLPVVLPEVVNYQPTDTGESPLANIHEWVETNCPKCGGKARRETDTMPNWAGSDWYFIRFTDPKNDKAMASMDLMRKWLPVDTYIGGDEHNTLHMLYSRFIYQFLWDLGVVPKEIPEPYIRRVSHGVILGPDGARMSKSRGNVIVPDKIVEQYGADVLRVYLMFMGPFEATMVWNERTMMGVARFLKRFEGMIMTKAAEKAGKTEREALIAINSMLKKVGEDMGYFKFNTAIAKMMETMNVISGSVSREDLTKMVTAIAPLAPFLAEKLWKDLKLEGSVHIQSWPEVDEMALETSEVNIVVQVNGKVRENVLVKKEKASDESEVVSEAKKSEKLAKWLKGNERVIFVPNRLINFVYEKD